MARLEQNTYTKMSKSALKRPVVLVVDMIKGFIRQGALADGEIAAAAPPIEQLLSDIDSVFIADAHTKQAREFEAYPVHCLQGSQESEIIEELQPYMRTRLEKNSTNAFFSPEFQSWFLQHLDAYDDFIITGCCTDLCVLQLALSLQGWLNQNDYTDKRVILPADCVDTYDIAGSHDACFWNMVSLQNMAANGIHVVESLA